MKDMGDIRSEYDPKKFYVVCMATRPGVQLFCTTLEYKHYPPRTPKNDLFGLNIVAWQGLTFYVVSVPLADRPLCEAVAKKTGMRLADGVPTLIEGRGVKHFPLEGDNVWSLEGNFEGDEAAEVEKIFAGDKDQMLADFQAISEIRHGTLKDLDDFLETAVDCNSFSPIMAILFGGDRRRCVNECFMAYIQERPFACCTISHRGEQDTGHPAIVGLYNIPKARNLGLGTRLFRATLQHCIDKGLTPVHVNVMSDTVMRMIEGLPDEMADKLVVNYVKGYDLTKLEEPYVQNKHWYVGQ